MNSFIAGLSIGIGTAFLFAPTSGRQTRRQLAQRASSTLGSLKQRASRVAPEELSEQVSSVGERVSELAGRVQSQVTQAAQAAQGRAARERDIADLLNNCSKDELVAVKGIGPVLADRIIRHRPYSSDREVLEREVLGEPTFRALKEEFLKKSA